MNDNNLNNAIVVVPAPVDEEQNRRRRRDEAALPPENNNNAAAEMPPQQRIQREEERRRRVHNARLRNDEGYRTAFELWRRVEMLQRNDPNLTTWCPLLLQPRDADFIFLLSGALMNSTHLAKLELRHVTLTESDARALVEGVNHSQIKALTIVLESSPDKKLEEIWRILCQGIKASRTIQELKLQSVSNAEIDGLGDLLSSLTSLKRLGLENVVVLSESSAESLAQGIRESKLESLSISRNITRGSKKLHTIWWTILDQGLKQSTTIEQVIFHASSKDDMFAFAFALPMMHSLRKLVVNHVAWTEPIAHAFAKGISQSSHLTKLTVRMPMYGNDQAHVRLQEGYHCAHMLADVLQRNTSLTTLELLHCDLNDGMSLLAQGLTVNAVVSTLVLEQCWMGDAGVETLFSQGLKHNTTLTNLKFKKCHGTESEVRSLARHWNHDSPIQSLYMESSHMNPDEAQELFRKVGNHPAMRKLELRNDRSHPDSNIGYEGLRLIAQELPNQRYLTNLDLSACASFVEMKQSESTARDQVGHALVEGMKHNLSIRHLNVLENSLPPDAVKEIDFLVGLNRTGRYLLSTIHSLATSVWSPILAKCQTENELAASLTYFYLREQPHLVQPLARYPCFVDQY